MQMPFQASGKRVHGAEGSIRQLTGISILKRLLYLLQIRLGH